MWSEIWTSSHRRYFDHRPTIRPNAKKLYRLFNDRHNLTWDEFASQVRTFQVGFMGEPNEVKPGRGEFHEHPLSCICEKPSGSRAGDGNDVDMNIEGGDEGYSEDDQDMSETEYAEVDNGIRERVLPNRRDPVLKTDQPELEEILSD